VLQASRVDVTVLRADLDEVLQRAFSPVPGRKVVKPESTIGFDRVVERGKAFAGAGASGFFVPRLADPRQIERVVREVPLPLNVIAFPGAPDKKLWAEAGVARISHGPFPHRALMAKLTEMAREAIA
jgi:2-methylisocitrate lyase-like PEP mutase family enzyme